MNEIRLPVIYSKGYNVLTGTAELTKYLFFQGWLERVISINDTFVSHPAFWMEYKQRGGIELMDILVFQN